MIKECQNDNIDLSLYFLKKVIFNSKYIEPLQNIRKPLQNIRKELKDIKYDLKNINNNKKFFNDR